MHSGILIAVVVLTASPTPAPAAQSVSPRPAPWAGIVPALSANALREELRAASRRREEELATLTRERARLEELAAETAAARASLAAERAATTRPEQPRPEPAAPAAVSAAAMSTFTGAAATPDRRSGTPAPASIEGLAKTVRGMKSEQAAGLIGRVERPLAVEVLRRMRPGDAGAILEKLEPEMAAEIFSSMAARAGTAGGGSR